MLRSFFNSIFTGFAGFTAAAFFTGAAFLATAFLATAFLAGAFFTGAAFLATAFFAGAAVLATAFLATLFLSALDTATIVLWFFRTTFETFCLEPLDAIPILYPDKFANSA